MIRRDKTEREIRVKSVQPILKNPNHPTKGSTVFVEPIRSLEAIGEIKDHLSDKPRDYCLFVTGINTAYRASELVSLTIGQVAHLRTGDILRVLQPKTDKFRSVTLNEAVVCAMQSWLNVHPSRSDPDAPLFISSMTGKALRANTVTRFVKSWCETVGLEGNYGSHTLRKTWGYHQRKTFNQSTALLMRAFGHASEAQTLAYLCIQSDEIDALYAQAL